MKKLILIFTVLILNTNIVNSQDYWEIINTPLEIDIYSIEVNSNGDIFIAVPFSPGGGVLRNLNNLNSWDTSLFFNNDVIGKIYIDKSDNVFAASDRLYFSDNNGISWSLIFNVQGLGINSVLRNSDNSIIFGKWGGIYKTDTIGSNWVQVLSLGNTEVVSAIIEDANTGKLYAGTINFIGGGGVYLSEDGGDTWEHFGLTNHYVSSLALNSSGDLFAGTRGHHYLYSGGVYILQNGQSEWMNLNNEELVTSMVINSQDEIYIACSMLDFYWGGVRRSMDNGQTWEDISLETMCNYDIEDIILGPEEHLYVNKNNSPTPLYKSINSTVSIHENKNNSNFITYNYPNPFSNETTIAFTLPGDFKTPVLNIYNMQGRIIRQYNIAGKKSQQWDGRDWNGNPVTNGIYFYNINYENISSQFNKLLFINKQ